MRSFFLCARVGVRVRVRVCVRVCACVRLCVSMRVCACLVGGGVELWWVVWVMVLLLLLLLLLLVVVVKGEAGSKNVVCSRNVFALMMFFIYANIKLHFHIN